MSEASGKGLPEEAEGARRAEGGAPRCLPGVAHVSRGPRFLPSAEMGLVGSCALVAVPLSACLGAPGFGSVDHFLFLAAPSWPVFQQNPVDA